MEGKTTESWALNMKVPLEPGIVCHDINCMLDFYVGVLGLQLVADAQTMPELSEKFGATPHGYRIVRLQTPYGERIKLVQPNKQAPSPKPVPQWVFERHGLSYLTFVIENIQGIVKRLRAYGVKMMSEEPVEVRKGVFALYTVDPEGNYVEFVEYPDIAAYRPDLFKSSSAG